MNLLWAAVLVALTGRRALQVDDELPLGEVGNQEDAGKGHGEDRGEGDEGRAPKEGEEFVESVWRLLYRAEVADEDSANEDESGACTGDPARGEGL